MRPGCALVGHTARRWAEALAHDAPVPPAPPGFTPEERASFKANLLDGGFVDGFRATYPTAVAYSYWGYRFNARANNKGWRLDYFLVSQQLQTHVHDCFHMPNVMGSDHCPLGLVLKL